MIKEMKEYNANQRSFPLGVWFNYFDKNEINFDAWYQRDYVWEEKEQQEFLKAFFKGFPIGIISTIRDENADQLFEIVDGKQRLTTLKMFYDNKIPFNGVLYKDLSLADSRYIDSILLPSHDLIFSTESDKLKYFYSVNFTGVPQSTEHKEFILSKI